MKKLVLWALALSPFAAGAQNVMTAEQLWTLGRVSFIAQSPDQNTILYQVAKTDLKTEKSSKKYFFYHNGEQANADISGDYSIVQWDDNGLYAMKDNTLYFTKSMGLKWISIKTGLEDASDFRVSPDGRMIAYVREVQVETILGKDKYGDVPNSTAHIYTDLNYRHWDHFNEGKAKHIFIAKTTDSGEKDILAGEAYDAPQQPFGGNEDFIWSPDSRTLVYVSKKLTGKAYAQSTNTDLYAYNVIDGDTRNITEGMMGYDMSPSFSPDGQFIAWLSMRRDGFEADKNDVIIMDVKTGSRQNLTTNQDLTVDGGIMWNPNGSTIYFNATEKATKQIFEINLPSKNLHAGNYFANVMRRTKGMHDVTGMYGMIGNKMIVSRTDMNHASELFLVNMMDGSFNAITKENDNIYSKLDLSTVKMRMVTTSDNKQMGVWIIYPPNFDPNKKYPTLLYCQGGPQSAVSQFYSVRWNFQLMAANGYIIVAPNRRGLPGWGVKWNEDISKDWGGQPMRDYLAAIDDVSKEPYVDKGRLGAVGASYGGYSVFMLAGIHEGRFKSLIAHDGLFDMKSWYGTTEELWFANWDLGGNYWKKPTPKSYEQYNPSNFVDKWTAPIMIIQGGIDYRVPIEQGLEAYQAAQLRGIKSKLLYFPNENHWVLHAQNGLVWQREFFSWLKETL